MTYRVILPSRPHWVDVDASASIAGSRVERSTRVYLKNANAILTDITAIERHAIRAVRRGAGLSSCMPLKRFQADFRDFSDTVFEVIIADSATRFPESERIQ